MGCFMTDSMKAFWLGLFIIIAIVLAAWLILFLKPGVGDGKVTLTVRFSNIDKISQGTLVTFAGKPVGEVVEIREVKDPREAPADAFGNLYIYELILKVDSSVKIFTYDEINFATSGLLGEKSIAIVPRATPAGAAPAVQVTDEVLFARSTDRLEETLNKFSNVAGTFNETLSEMNIFIETNNQDFNNALKSLNDTAQQMSSFLARANSTDLVGRASEATQQLIATMASANALFSTAQANHLVDRMGEGMDCLCEAASLCSHGGGTIARLVNSDSFYIQLVTVLAQVQAVLHDINTYGLLYQFDRKWQRTHHLPRDCTEIPGVGYGQQ